MTTKNEKLEELAKLEKEAKGGESISETQNEETFFQVEEEETSKEELPSVIDGYTILQKSKLPYFGRFYPKSWEFAYRCPTAKEVANFSTVNEQDQPAIVNAIEELIKKCVVIIDSESGVKIPSGQINDGDRTFFLLLLREFYLPNKDITYNTMCMLCKNSVEVHFNSASLQYREVSDKLLSCFDGRLFTIPNKNLEEPIVFTIPTLDISGKIFRYLLKVYRDNQSDKDNKKESLSFDKEFLLVAPYLFETGKESMIQIKQKFMMIRNNGMLLNAYITIANSLKLENQDTIGYTCNCGSEEETLIKFPGGWKNMFVDTDSFEGIFE